MIDKNNFSDCLTDKEQEREDLNASLSSSKTICQQEKAKASPRRIGTMTLGISLILLGSVLIVYLFHPFSLLNVIKISPVLLILLGIEILWQYFRNGGKNLRYDFGGTLFCIFITVISLGLSAFYPIYMQFGPANWKVERQVEQQIYNEIYNLVPQNSPVIFLEVNANLNSASPAQSEFELKDLTPADHISLYFHFSNQDNAHTFARNVRSLLDSISTLNYENLSVTVSAPYHGGEFTLSLYDRFQLHMTVDQLQQMISDSQHIDDENPNVEIERAEAIGES